MVDGFGGATTSTSLPSTHQHDFGPRGTEKQRAALLIVDSTVADQHLLLEDLDPRTQVVRAEAGKMDEVVAALQIAAGIDTLHILTHGEPGAFTLAGERIDATCLDQPSAFSAALKSASQIALWACSVAKDAVGAHFVDKLAALSGAAVAATHQLVGNTDAGGTWMIGADSPFSTRAMAAYPHTLPTIGTEDFGTSISVLATDTGTSSSNISGSGLTASYSGNTDAIDIILGAPADALSTDGNNLYGEAASGDKSLMFGHFVGSGGLAGEPHTLNYISLKSDNGTDTFNLDGFSIYYRATGSVTFTVTAHDSSGTQIGSGVTLNSFTTASDQGYTAGYMTVSDGTLGSDFSNIVEFRLTPSSTTTVAMIGLDDVVVSAAITNSAPDLGGTPADDTATEDVATAIDLSAYNISDSDGDTITLTLEVDRGTIASTDGNGTTSGVTVATSGTTSMTLSGSVSDLNTYLNDTSKITFTTDSNDTTSATLTVTPNDGTVDGTADTVTITITAVNDAPVLDNSQSPTLTAIDEDAGDDDGSGADGDDDATNNSNNSGTTVATLVVDSSITDVDGSTVESIAVTTVDNTNGVWQYSTDSGTSWNNFSGTTGSSVDIETSARLLDSTDMIRFVPDADYNGSATFTFRAWDESSGSAGSTADASSNGGSTAFSSASDTASVTVNAVNDDPTISGLVTDVTVTEDTASDLNLSASAFADVDSTGTVTVYLIADSGTMTATSGGSVTVSGSGSGTLTLSGTIANINTFLDTASAVQYTGASNDSGDNAATLTVRINDGDGSGNVDVGSVNIDITAVNDAPVLDSSQSPTLTAIDEDAGDDDGSGADGDDDATNNANNTGTTVATMVVDSSITDADGSAVESIAVTAVDNTNGVWQYSTDTGTTWTNFSGTTGSTVSFESTARLLDSTDMIRFVPDADYNGSATITFRAWDETSGTAGSTADASSSGGSTAFSSASDTASITVNAVNDAPTFSGLDGTPSFTEGGSVVTFDSDVTISDLELDAADNFSGASLTITRNGGANTADDFDFNTSGASFTVSGGNLQSGGNTFATFTDTNGTLTINFTSSATAATGALVDNVLQRITYQNTSDDPGSSAQLDWTFSDGTDSDTGSTTVTITGVNDEPTLTATGADPTFTEGGANSDLFSGVTIDTVESGQTITGLTFTVTNVSDSSEEFMIIDGSVIDITANSSGTTVTNSLSYNVSFSGGTVTITLSGGTMSEAEAQTLVDGLTYGHSGDDPSTGSSRVVTLTSITDSGSNTGNDDNVAALSVTSTVSITAVNDAPGIANLNGDNSSTVVAGDGAQDVTDLNDVAITNADSADYNGGSLTLSQISGTTNGSWSVDGTNVTSGGDGTISAGETISVGGTAIGTVHATNDGQGGNTLQIDFNTGDSTSANIQTLIRNLELSPPSGVGDRAFTLTLNDGDGTANGGDQDHSATFTVSVASQPPEATGIPTDITVTEDTASNVDLSGVTFSDGDDTALIVKLSVDAGTLTASTGGGVTVTGSGTATLELSGDTDDINTFLDDLDAVQYTGATDANGDNAATLSITANDDNGSGDVAVGSANIDITNVNDAAVFGGDLTATMNEDADTVGGTATATDVDNPDTFQATTPGGMYGDLQIEANGDWVYDLDEANSDVQALNAGDTLQDTITVQSTDGSNQDIVITITGVNDAAVFGGTLTGNIGEDTDTVGGTASVTDVDNPDTFTAEVVAGSYGSLTIAENGGWVYDLDEANNDVQALAAGDTLQDTITVRANDDTNQDIVITISGVNDAATFGGDLTGAINEDGTTTTGTATTSDIDTGEGNFDADTIDGANGTLVIAANGDWTYTIDNGDSAVQGLGAGDTLEDTITVASDDGTTQDIVITVTGVNDLPTSGGGSISTAEDISKAFSAANFNYSDVDTTDTLASVRIDTLPSTGTLKLSGVDVTAGDVIAVADIPNLRYTPASNASGSTNFTYTVNDGTGFATSSSTMTVSVSARNDAPTNISLTNSSVKETVPGAVIGTLSASDVDDSASSLSFTVSDSRFTIDADNQLKLKAGQTLDFETEGSVTVTVTVSDDDGASSTRDFTITVIDVNEVVDSGSNDDTLNGSSNDDYVAAGSGNNKINTGNGQDTIDGGDGNDDINGGNDDDFLKGGGGDDTVDGGFGNDLVYAGLGDIGNDTVRGSGGFDSLGGGAGNDKLDGGDNDDLLWGRSGNDTVDGGTGDDMLYNGEGSDTVFGGTGDDTLWAGSGDDVLSGGSGEDVFIFGATSGNDTITDFAITDDTLDFTYVGAGFAALADIQAAASNITRDGEDGLLIDLSNGQSVFLIGLDTSDLASMNINF